MKEISKITISDSLVTGLHVIIEEGRKKAFAAAGKIAILTYWNIGRRIVEEEQQGNTRAEDMWSVKTLDRNISTHYYERRLASQCEDTAIAIPHRASAPMECIKNPMVAEFMGFRRDNNYSENQLEQALVDNLEKFILELGRGFAFQPNI